MKKAVLYILVVCLLTAGSASVAYFFLYSGKVGTVPNLSGKLVKDAELMSRSAGLRLKVESEEYSLRIPPGKIISQDMLPGELLNGTEGVIKVVLSKGPLLYNVPSLIGNTIAEAREIMKGRGINPKNVFYVHSDRDSKDIVITQSPKPNEKSIEPLTLIVSKGPYDVIYYCPHLIGKPKDEAVSILRELGLNSMVLGSGMIVNSQKPDALSLMNAGGVVYLRLE